jgi:hypothetical protein
VLVIGLLYPMRRMERWLHQHLFKVGWLFTKNLRRTTILYYCLFLPGVVLYEFVYWLAAGLVNVRAEAAFAWPETQASAELKLNFVKLGKNVGQVKLALISLSPLLVGIIVIAFIANNILNVPEFLEIFQPDPISGEIDAAAALESAIAKLFAIPDLWLWFYLIFTIANTMMPDPKSLRGMRPILIAAAGIVAGMYALGVGDAIMLALLGGSLARVLDVLGLTFGVIIAVDLFMIAVLGSIEALVERLTGDSAAFHNGKLIAMRREEIIQQRQQEREKQQKRLEAARRAPLSSIYDLPLPIPGAPSSKNPAAQGASPAEAEPV